MPGHLTRASATAVLQSHEGSSPLLDLAAELRNNIYHFVLTNDEPLAVKKEDIQCHTALLDTYNQIKAEATSIFYLENDFIIPVDLENIIAAAAWLECIENKVTMIKKFSVHVGLSCAGSNEIDVLETDYGSAQFEEGYRIAKRVWEERRKHRV